VSEVMLQQTQVSRVMVAYPAFLARFGSFEALAEAPMNEVLEQWQGMGYNRRTLWLRSAAQIVVSEHGGVLPRDPEVLVKLPGIGPNTAGSLAAFAYEEPVVFIETNIRRVFIHHYEELSAGFADINSLGRRTLSVSSVGAVSEPAPAGRELISDIALPSSISDKELLPLIAEALDRERPREWYYALMDYGAALAKKVSNPNRRSKHYVVQSKFEGSVRQIRGEVLRQLLRGPKMADDLKIADGRLGGVLEIMVKEGFVAQKSEKYHIAGK
jgi:A/G-specific adenine glycosylase